jgi:hypothetical protein
MNQQILGLTLIGAAAFATSCSNSSGGKSFLKDGQVGVTSIDLATGAVTFTQPKQVKLSGTAVYDDPTDTVTLSLTITNKSKSLLHNPKVLLSGLSEGTVTGDGTFTSPPVPLTAEGVPGVPYVYFGPESIPTNGTASRDIEFTGVTGAGAELTADVEILVHPWIFVPGNDNGVVATDASGTGEELVLYDLGEIDVLGFDGESWQRTDSMSPDTRYVYYTNRNQAAIITFDTVDHTMTIGDSLIGGTIAFDGTGEVGCIDGMVASPDGKFLYATVNHGTHVSSFESGGSAQPFGTPTMVEVVKLDAATLDVMDRVTVWTPPPVGLGAGEGGGGTTSDIRGRVVSVTPDGTRGAISITGASEVSLLNLSNMTVMDTWTTSGAVPRHPAISADASTIAVAYTSRDGSDGTLELIDTATGSLTDLAPDTLDVGTNTSSGFLSYGPDGRLYYGRAYNGTVPGVSIYDPIGDTWSEIAGYGNAIRFGDDAWCIWDNDADEVRCFDYTDVELTFPGSGSIGIPVVAASFGHGLLFTE